MIVFVIRHANRKPEPDDDLTPAGFERAKLLARTLGESGVRTVFCSSAQRARNTIQPLKDLLGDRLEIMSVCVRSTTHIQQIVDGVKALPENVVAAVIGHSDTVGPIIEGLSGRSIDQIAGHEFDKLFVLSITSAGVSTVALTRYGEPT
jgi:phosphohistidine phosphatase SixA